MVQYKLAAEGEISDPAPLSNLSATYFELGNYNSSVDFTLESLQLTDIDDLERRQKLNVRLAKCYIHLRQYGKARAAVEDIKPSTDRKILAKSLVHMSSTDISESDIDSARAKVINSIPRYKPALCVSPIYLISLPACSDLFIGHLYKPQATNTDIGNKFRSTTTLAMTIRLPWSIRKCLYQER